MTQPTARALPDYLPARMLNEYVYCPRLFFYEWVDGVFAESADTVEGKAQHTRVDAGKGELPAPSASVEGEALHARSVTLASERHRVIAKLDLVEIDNGRVTPVDYKHGKPRETHAGLELWPADQAQLAVQALVLRDNGYQCDEGLAYYWKTRQRVRLAFTEEVLTETLAQIDAAWALAERGEIPPPLVDSSKCTGCSLAAICLPDETNLLRYARPAPGQLVLFPGTGLGESAADPEGEVRRLTPPRADRRPVYLNTQGFRMGRSGSVLQVKDKEKLVQEIRIAEICQVNVMGNIQITTQAIQSLCDAGVPVCYYSLGGWFFGITTGLNTKNVFLRMAQFALANSAWFPLKVARKLVAGKIRNQRTMLLRNHLEPPATVLQALKELIGNAENARALDELLGLEGYAARLYFQEFAGLIKAQGAAGEFSFDFTSRNRRPPRDPVNALLSLAYSLLAKDLTIACYAVGFDPLVGFYHQPRFGRPALALDLMEPFRPLIADSAVLNAINTRMVTARDFVRAGNAVSLTAEGRKGFFRAYEARMDTLVTHPLFEYRTSYRRLLEIQTRLLARVLEGEIGEYPVFVTR